MAAEEDAQEIPMMTIVWTLLLVIILISIFYFLKDQQENSSNWAALYAKEIANIINRAESGTEVTLDIQKPTEIAIKHEIDPKKTFKFNNEKKEICVQLSPGRKNCYSFYNNLRVENEEILLGKPNNILKFKLV